MASEKKYGYFDNPCHFTSAASWSVLITAGVFACADARAQIVPRMPTVHAQLPANALPKGPTTPGVTPRFAKGSNGIPDPTVVSGNYDPDFYSVLGNTATVKQNSETGILTWDTFNIGSGMTLQFQQPSTTSVTLNNVNADQTIIDGQLKANGQVYIYNPRGIIFSKTAMVNVNSLFASTLKIDNSRFLAGILAPSALPVFSSLADAAFPGAVTVEGASINGTVQQAHLNAAPGGKIVLLAPDVTNNGAISAPNGQVILGAGREVFLSGPDFTKDANLRGLDADVNNKAPDGSSYVSTAKNDVLGKIAVGNGNATLAGAAVKQWGLVSATTTVNENGTIYLRARDDAAKGGTAEPVDAKHFGSLQLGAGSVTQVLPDYADKTLSSDDPAFKPSTISLSGNRIALVDNAEVVATGGKVTIDAKDNSADHTSRVDLGSRSVIDVSGSTGTQLAMERNVVALTASDNPNDIPMDANVVKVELRGSELADNLLLRDSLVRGKTVMIDVRKGTKIANVSGYLKQLQHNIGERTAAGGTVAIKSEQDIIQRTGGSINVSGGSVEYQSGYVNTSKLTAGGAVFDIGSASPDRAYDGVVNFVGQRSSYELGYVEGKDAGTVSFNAPGMLLQGGLTGKTVIGERQRVAGAKGTPLSGGLRIGSDMAAIDTGRQKLDNLIFKSDVHIGNAKIAVAEPGANKAFNTTTPVSLDMNQLGQSGFGRFYITTDGNIDVDSATSLAAGGILNLGASKGIDFKAGVSMPSGNLVAKTTGTLTVADGAAFDLAGRWTNDRSQAFAARDANGLPTQGVILNGGKLDLAGVNVVVGNGVSIDVSGGAWLDTTAKLTAGDGGSIRLDAVIADPTTPLLSSLHMGSGLNLSAYGVVKGGSLKLTGRNINVGSSASNAGQDLSFSSDFFQRGGFSSYDIGANGNFNVDAGTAIKPRSLTWGFNAPRLDTQVSSAMSAVASPKMLDLLEPFDALARISTHVGRPATSVAFSANNYRVPGSNVGRLTFGTNASISTDPGASVTLSANRLLTMDGVVDAPGGGIAITLANAYTNGIADDYDPTRSIWFGPHAQLLARGSADLLYTNSAFASGELLDGGSIHVGGNGGASAAGFIIAEKGSMFDVSGVTRNGQVSFRSGRDVTTLSTVSSNGGSIDMSAGEGLMFNGTLAGAGGAGAGGGSLTMALDRNGNIPNSTYSQAARTFALSGNAGDPLLAAGWKPGMPIALQAGAPQAWLSTSAFQSGGFDRLDFKSQDTLVFSGPRNSSLTLSAPSSITLDAPRFDVATGSDAVRDVTLNSAYIQLGNADLRYRADPSVVPTTTSGGASLTANAKTIDLIGGSAADGFGQIALNAAEDIRLVGVVDANLVALSDTGAGAATGQAQVTDPIAPGSFSMTGNLILDASQIYPTTLSSFTLNVAKSSNANGVVTFRSSGKNVVQDPLSAGGSLTVNADRIVQGGRVLAPFGSIAMNAATKLSYMDGSVTSVAGKGVVPFGSVVNGRDWVYQIASGVAVNFKLDPQVNSVQAEKPLPSKAIVSTAPTIATAAGATIDLSGGGTLYGYEFTPGPGGSRDVLSNDGSAPTVWAINPNYHASAAPKDFQYDDKSLHPGDSVYLAGTKDLPAGVYTLLPAHYALLPGGYSISLASNSRDLAADTDFTNRDNSQLVAGYRTVNGSSINADGANMRRSGFVIYSGDLIRKRSEYAEYDANTFFSRLADYNGETRPALPQDGGHLVFDATRSLSLNGLVKMTAGTAGAGGDVDISAPAIEVVASDDVTPVQNGVARLTADKLSAFHADSILLGGVRTDEGDGSTVQVKANTVTVKNLGSQKLSAPEIILAARGTVQLDAGAAVSGEGMPSGATKDITIAGSGAGANGALLRVSGGAAASVTRNAPALNDPGNVGTLNIAAGATVAAAGSAYLDATHKNNLNGKLNIASGGALGMAAPHISLGNGIPQNPQESGLVFGGAALSTLSGLSALELSSYSTIDMYGTFNVGSAAQPARELTFKGAGMTAHGNAGDRIGIFADTVKFGNSGNIAQSAAASSPVAALTVQTRDIEVGNNQFSLNGLTQTNLTARHEIRATGNGGMLTADHDMTLAAGRITSSTGKEAGFSAAGDLALTTVASPETPAGATGLGGSLAFNGDTVSSDTNIVTQAGRVALTGAHGVNISGGSISAAGAVLDFGSTKAYAPGGAISLDGGTAGVEVGANATLDVSAAGADAGTLSIKASDPLAGRVAIDGTLKGRATAGLDGKTPTQGRFDMDVGAIASSSAFDALNNKLNTGGFTESRAFRVREGHVDQNGILTAHNVLIAVDDGNLNVGGTIDASGAKGGSIALYTSQATGGGNKGNVLLKAGSKLNASATVATATQAGSTGRGGSVIIGTESADGIAPQDAGTGSSITVDGAVIDVSGKGAGRGGQVTFRAPRVVTASDAAASNMAGSDVAIAKLDATVAGSERTSIEGYKVYNADKISQAADARNADGSYSNLQAASAAGTPAGVMYSDAQAFSGNEAAILNRLLPTGTNVTLRSGIEVRAPGDLVVSVNEGNAVARQNRGWDLNQWRFGTDLQPGALTLRAAGDLNIQGSISDGFVKTTANGAMPNWKLDSGPSWSYRFSGGTDMNGAYVLATTPDGTKGNVNISFARTSTAAGDQAVALVRTGTGTIDIAAGHDVVLGQLKSGTTVVSGATVYTAGRSNTDSSGLLPEGFAPPKNSLNTDYVTGTPTTAGEFSDGGGGISIHAANDVTGAPVPQLINNWLFRQGRMSTDASNDAFQVVSGQVLRTEWWSRFDYFKQGVATFGGGDVSIVADAGSVKDFSASVATNAYLPGLTPKAQPLVERGGGDLTVRAGGDIAGGTFYVQKGNASIRADGAVVAGSREILDTSGNSLGNLRTLLAAGDAKLDVTAVKGLAIETTFNPTMTAQSVKNAVRTGSNLNTPAALQASDFSTYGEDSAVKLTAIGGNLSLDNNAVRLSFAGGSQIPGTFTFPSNLYLLQPGTLRAQAMSGDIAVNNGFTLVPSASGQLDLLAFRTLAVNPGNTSNVVMLDVATDALPAVTKPRLFKFSGLADESGILKGTVNDLTAHGNFGGKGLHGDDSDPARLIALTGDIVGNLNPTDFVLPKKSEIIAGRDIRDLSFDIQHNNPGDETHVTAGRDFVDTTITTGTGLVGHVVTGPGRVDFTAGRNFDLGNGNGVVTNGNLYNPNLLASGASIAISAGAGAPDYVSMTNFASRYGSVSDLTEAQQTALVDYLRTLKSDLPKTISTASAWDAFQALQDTQKKTFFDAHNLSASGLFAENHLTAADQADLIAFVRARRSDVSTGISGAQAWDAFQTLATSDRKTFLEAHKPTFNKVFFAELVQTSNVPGFANFDALIASLYPVSNLKGGDINVFGSQIKTERGGSIDLFAPSGSIYAGLSSLPSYIASKSASELGIFTVPGDIRALVKNDFSVFQGRAFSVGGGDVTLVSQYGNIDAGRGAKTAVSAPPPLLVTDAKGNTHVDISSSIAGSGIATLKTQSDQPDASVFVAAPRGFFDAGDAGVRSTGSISIQADRVLNADNLHAGGAITGAPAAEPSAPSTAAAPPPPNAVAKADDLGKIAANTEKDKAASLTVDVLGYGTDCEDPSSDNSGCADAKEERKKK